MSEVKDLPRLQKYYREVVREQMQKEFGYKNPFEVPSWKRSSSTWAWAKPPATRRSLMPLLPS